MIDCEDEWKLWSLLLLMTKRKVNRRVREAQQAKRDIRREFLPAVSEDVSGIELADIVENSDNESYDESALLLEKALLYIESNQAKATAPSHREVLELTMRGMPYSEICETLKQRVGKEISLKMIQRKMRDIREAVLEVVAADSE